MSHASNARLLRRLEQRHASTREGGLANLAMMVQQSYEAEHSAAEAAKAPTETGEGAAAQPTPSSPSPSADKLAGTAPPVPPAPPEHSRFVWSKKVRPGPNDVLTWEEAMRVPWIEGDEGQY